MWSPNGITHEKNTESFRKFKWSKRYHFPPYRHMLHRLLLFHMITLEDRRGISQVLYVLSFVNGKVSSSNLLPLINFRVPTNFTNERFTRNRQLLNQLLSFTDNSNDPFKRMKIDLNEYTDLFVLNHSNEIAKNYVKIFIGKTVLTNVCTCKKLI